MTARAIFFGPRCYNVKKPLAPRASPCINDVMETALRKYRADNGVTLADLAEKTGITVSHLSRLERWRAGVSLANAIVLAKVTGLPIESFAKDPV